MVALFSFIKQNNINFTLYERKNVLLQTKFKRLTSCQEKNTIWSVM